MRIFGHFHIKDDRKKYCPECSHPLKRMDNEADTNYLCKKCGLMTYNHFKYEAEFVERGSINIKHIK